MNSHVYFMMLGVEITPGHCLQISSNPMVMVFFQVQWGMIYYKITLILRNTIANARLLRFKIIFKVHFKCLKWKRKHVLRVKMI